MNHTNIISVVLPVPDTNEYPYLTILVGRAMDFTTMIWGWQKNPSKMARPALVMRTQQPYVPFLFSQTEQENKKVTHVGVSGLIVHKSDQEYPQMASWLRERRVEKFSGVPNWHDEVGSFYVVTGTEKLDSPIPYEALKLEKGGIPLSPKKMRGYSIVFLPESLAEWFGRARSQWDQLAYQLPKYG